MKRLLSQILNLFFPTRCPVCNEIGQRHMHLCDRCEEDVVRITDRCLGCGSPRTGCTCSKHNFSLFLASPFIYENKIRDAIHRFKFGGETDLVKFFGRKRQKPLTKSSETLNSTLLPAYRRPNASIVNAVTISRLCLQKKLQNSYPYRMTNCC